MNKVETISKVSCPQNSRALMWNLESERKMKFVNSRIIKRFEAIAGRLKALLGINGLLKPAASGNVFSHSRPQNKMVS